MILYKITKKGEIILREEIQEIPYPIYNDQS